MPHAEDVEVIESKVLQVVVERDLDAIDRALEARLTGTPVRVIPQFLGVSGADVPALETVHQAVAEQG